MTSGDEDLSQNPGAGETQENRQAEAGGQLSGQVVAEVAASAEAAARRTQFEQLVSRLREAGIEINVDGGLDVGAEQYIQTYKMNLDDYVVSSGLQLMMGGYNLEKLVMILLLQKMNPKQLTY